MVDSSCWESILTKHTLSWWTTNNLLDSEGINESKWGEATFFPLKRCLRRAGIFTESKIGERFVEICKEEEDVDVDVVDVDVEFHSIL